LAALKSCDLLTGAEPEEPCGEVAVRRDGQYFDYTISTTRPDGAWTAEEAYSLDEDADELDHYFEVSEIDADLVARLGNLCHALEADAASADFMVRTLPLNDGGFTLIYELGCETRGGSYYFQVAGQDVVLRTQVAR
jgi:hypothetical protein